jgi:hypothetical protein
VHTSDRHRISYSILTMLYLFRKEREGKAALLSLPQEGKEA